MRHFTEEEVKDLIWDNDDNIIEEILGEDHRWWRHITCIVKQDEKFYSLYWQKGLTENNGDHYPEQDAPEVTQVDRKLVIKEWIEVKDEIMEKEKNMEELNELNCLCQTALRNTFKDS